MLFFNSKPIPKSKQPLHPDRLAFNRGLIFAIDYMNKAANKEAAYEELSGVTYSKSSAFDLGIQDYLHTLDRRAAKAIDQVHALYPTNHDLIHQKNLLDLQLHQTKLNLKTWLRGILPTLALFLLLFVLSWFLYLT